MSLDVYLIKRIPACGCCGRKEEEISLYSANITHNLNKMANEAGIYHYLWRPDELLITKAKDLIKPLQRGLKLMKNDPKRFEKFDSSNGWGTYKDFVPWIEEYLEACKTYPDAEVEVSR